MYEIAFIDFETSGLDPNYHEPVSVAITRTDWLGTRVIEKYDARMVLRRPERATHEALRINGYDETGKWAPQFVTPHQQVAEDIHRLTKGAILAGQNTKFDRTFATAFLAEFWLKLETARYHDWDLVSYVGLPLALAGRIKNPSLVEIAGYFGLKQPEPHDARADTDLTHKIFCLWTDRVLQWAKDSNFSVNR